MLTTLNIFVERVNIAANALIAKQAADAKLLLAAQQLAECREQTNPWLPGNSPFGPPQRAMWAPDPCAEQVEAVREAETLQQAAAALTRPSPATGTQDLTQQPVAQLSQTNISDILYDPTQTEAEFAPNLENWWSPTSIEDVMIRLAEEMGGMGEEDEEEMELVYNNLVTLIHWSWQGPPKRKRKKYKLNLENVKWTSWLVK